MIKNKYTTWNSAMIGCEIVATDITDLHGCIAIHIRGIRGIRGKISSLFYKPLITSSFNFIFYKMKKTGEV